MMTAQQLLEAAQLQALGLLDEADRVEFEAALQAASPELRAQIRQEQARLVGVDPWTLAPEALNDEIQPPADLRERVLAKWRETVRGVLHGIDRASGDAGAGARAEAGLGEVSASGLVAGSVAGGMRSHAGGRDARVEHRGVLAMIDADHHEHARRMGGSRVSPLWRAAAVGLLAASVGFAVSTLHVLGRYNDLSERVNRGAVVEALQQTVGSSRVVRDMLYDRQTRFVHFEPVGEDVRGQATLVINPAWDEASEGGHAGRLFVMNLVASEGTSFRLVVLNAEGGVERNVAQITTSGELGPHMVRVSAGELTRLAVMMVDPQGNGRAVLQAAAA
ncbi:MAG: hypothetical protein SFZ23_11025 [Planctomycetota bacterium]|nr:hypothetical protein [Planctomycetota bacterium]